MAAPGRHRAPGARSRWRARRRPGRMAGRRAPACRGTGQPGQCLTGRRFGRQRGTQRRQRYRGG
ncbi:hypothetical protein F0402_10640 [Mycolicibacter arupensis]|nr:hypothetical protein F0402_10640 [Mycolicibacter arupensis]